MKKGIAYQAAIITIFLILIVLPHFQKITGIIPEPRLNEKRQPAAMPEVLADSFITGEFQDQFNAYMNDNFGFRSWLVMINNQINITVFHTTR